MRTETARSSSLKELQECNNRAFDDALHHFPGLAESGVRTAAKNALLALGVDPF